MQSMTTTSTPWIHALGACALIALTACGPADGAIAQNELPDELREQLGEAPMAMDTAGAANLSGAFRAASAEALPAVVYVEATLRQQPQQRRMPQIPGFEDMFPQPSQPSVASGSGFVFDETGHIMTNHHVVEQAEFVTIRFVDGRQFDAEVVGSDPDTDVAVLRLLGAEDQDFGVAALGNSDQVRVGDWVLALGSPLNLDFTVTAGIVSAKARQIGILGERTETGLESFIQTDAAINRGNSGGPLVDLRGRVVGINTAIGSQTGQFIGYGFAIPINIARRVAADLLQYGAVRRPQLGVLVQSVNADIAEAFGLDRVAGSHITQVQPDSPAEDAGLQPGDVIVSLDGDPLTNETGLTTELAQRQPGDEVEIGFVRDGERRSVTVELGEFESGTAQQADTRQQEEPSEGRLGFRVTPLGEEMAAALGVEAGRLAIADVRPNSPAAAAGLDPYQILLSINGEEVSNVADLERIAAEIEGGEAVRLTVIVVERQGNRLVNLGERSVVFRTRR